MKKTVKKVCGGRFGGVKKVTSLFRAFLGFLGC